jgi:hypothetical protein
LFNVPHTRAFLTVFDTFLQLGTYSTARRSTM